MLSYERRCFTYRVGPDFSFGQTVPVLMDFLPKFSFQAIFARHQKNAIKRGPDWIYGFELRKCACRFPGRPVQFDDINMLNKAPMGKLARLSCGEENWQVLSRIVCQIEEFHRNQPGMVVFVCTRT